MGHINSLHLDSFANPTGGAFLNSSTTSALSLVPEPETYAMLLAGLGLIGTIARRRRAAQRR
ncbi:MAG: PEPxxWA-CTERM sorting domain-containing protein [Comamonadaceae bacterium]|nr:PEPxxWA-CTERM sorting domain-containing protein [Comamonadaceae bacterium]